MCSTTVVGSATSGGRGLLKFFFFFLELNVDGVL